MNELEQRQAAKQFAQDWKDRGDEKQDTQSFWLALLQTVFGVTDATKYIQFEMPVKLDHCCEGLEIELVCSCVVS